MIKNVIFDMGDVLIDYRWKEMLLEIGCDEKTANDLGHSIFWNPAWLEVDKGTLTPAEFKKILLEQRPEDAKGIERLFSSPEEMPVARTRVWEKYYDLKRAGYKVYVLSNYNAEWFNKHTSIIPFMGELDGIIVSCEHGLLKPEKEIYQKLLDEYELNANECIFFDDREANARGAQAVGIKGVYVPDENALLNELDKLMKVVVFDMDGVIFDSERLVMECWKKVADKYGIRDVEIPCTRCLGTNSKVSEELFKEFYGQDFPYRDYKSEESAMYHEAAARGELKLMPGVIGLLEYLKRNDYRMAIASSTRIEIVQKQIIDAGIAEYFDEIIGGDMVSRSKPNPDIYLKACENMLVEPRNAYAIEDSYNGIRAAFNAGMRPIMVPDMLEANDEMRKLSYMICDDLFGVISGLEQKARLDRQMAFILEMDKSKKVIRQTFLSDGSKKEDDAQHAWHLALMAYVLAEHANEPVDVAKTMAMTLIHDLVEIDAGDTYAYDTVGNESKRERELVAAERIFGLLPEDQQVTLRALWDEFEENKTPEARFANTLDKVQPVMLNDASGGKAWLEHGIHKDQVVNRNINVTPKGSQALWNFTYDLIKKNVSKGKLKD